MFYNNTVCDGCGEVMHDGEDIVVCPVCGTPQHRECYNKNNSCVNESRHADGFVWEAPKKPHEIELENMKSSGSLPVAGTQINQPPQQAAPNTIPVSPVTGENIDVLFLRGIKTNPEEEFDGIKVREAAVYIQSRAGKYIGKYMKSKGKKRVLSWNWGAFFFSPYWFFYRKMYKIGTIFLLTMVALSLALIPVSDKLTPYYNELSTAMSEYNDSDRGEAASLIYVQKSLPVYKAMIPTLAILFSVYFLVPNTIAALIANGLYKKKMLKDVDMAHKGSNEQKIINLSLMRSGGVSILTTMCSIVIGLYLPSIILNIIDKFYL